MFLDTSSQQIVEHTSIHPMQSTPSQMHICYILLQMCVYFFQNRPPEHPYSIYASLINLCGTGLLQKRPGGHQSMLLLWPYVQKKGYQSHPADVDKLFLSIQSKRNNKSAEPWNLLRLPSYDCNRRNRHRFQQNAPLRRIISRVKPEMEVLSYGDIDKRIHGH